MKSSILARFLVAVIAVQLVGLKAAASPVDEMTDAANAFLSTLDDAQRDKATFDWDDKDRVDWHFIPKDRPGLPLKEMRHDQMHLAHALLATGMSRKGYVTAMTIMSLERVLHELENNAPHRDPSRYQFSIFGKPDAEGSWGWRVEGHHLSLNFTIVGGRFVSGTPSFYGTNPGEIREGARAGLKTAAVEEDLAKELAASLTSAQRKIAVVADKAPKDILTSANRNADRLKPLGIAIGALDEDQRDMLLELSRTYVFRIHEELAEIYWAKVRSTPELYFGWAGGTKDGDAHYYRIQGPDFLFEYDNVQNNANHVHAVWRDLKNDFGEDLLRKHYESVPHN